MHLQLSKIVKHTKAQLTKDLKCANHMSLLVFFMKKTIPIWINNLHASHTTPSITYDPQLPALKHPCSTLSFFKEKKRKLKYFYLW